MSKSGDKTALTTPIKTVTVIGAGIMGSGIAQVVAQASHNVTIIDLKPEILKKAMKTIQINLHRVGKRVFKDDKASIESFASHALSKIKSSTKLEDGANADLIIEAIVERLDAKQELFNKLDKLAPEHTILASNTSAISINEIGAGIKRKDRLGGLHFFNPVPVMPLLEVIRGDHTSDATHQTMFEWGQSIGKTCITCKDTPGFVVSRLLSLYSAEALRMYERGDATIEDIDTGMKLGAGYPMGPFELADYTGLDTVKYVQNVMYEKTGDPIFRPIALLDKMVAEGKLGIKTGEGFYKYNKKGRKANL